MAQRKKSVGKERATFSLFRQGNPAQKVGTVSFFGKSYKKAKAAGSRYLRKLGLTAPGQKISNPPKRRAVPVERKRKKVLSFGQRMARLRARKAKARKRR